jgi:hypothetical protein
MSYLLLIIEHEDRRRWSAETGQSRFEQMHRFADGLTARGVLQACESLRDLGGTRIQVRGGKRIVSDGPFAEAKEMVGGFFLLDCGSREEALAIAAECPAAGWAAVEVREVGPCWPPPA